ncbi:unnamed protein product, partial [Rotaria sordida]
MKTGSQPSSVAINDFNNDQIPDLAVSNYGTQTISILLGRGNADFNLDHNMDLATANLGENSFSILLGTGNGTFL